MDVACLYIGYLKGGNAEGKKKKKRETESKKERTIKPRDRGEFQLAYFFTDIFYKNIACF
jgi:hypothetical protein